jgi:hypothetical protein
MPNSVQPASATGIDAVSDAMSSPTAAIAEPYRTTATDPNRWTTRSVSSLPMVMAAANTPYANAAVASGASRTVLRCSTLQSFATPSDSISSSASPASAQMRPGVRLRVLVVSAVFCGGTLRSNRGVAAIATASVSPAVSMKVVTGDQPQLRVRAPASAARNPPTDQTAWNADMIVRP